MNNRGSYPSTPPIFPSLAGPWHGYVPSTHTSLSPPPPRFPYSVTGARTHQGYVPGGVLHGPATYLGHTSSLSSSLHSRSRLDYTPPERRRTLSPSVPRYLPEDEVVDTDPVVFNAGFTFRMGKETQQVHKHVDVHPAYTIAEAPSSGLTRQIGKFLKKSDHALDRYSSVIESRSSSCREAGRRGKSRTPGLGVEDYDSPDPSLNLSLRAQRSTSAASIAVKAEKHFELMGRIGSGRRVAAPIAEHEEANDLDSSSSSESLDEFDTDNDVLRSADVFDISDDTSADLSKLDDLSSDSDDEYFDVVPLPGLQPPPQAAQSPTKPPAAVAAATTTAAQHQQPPHLPPTHSQSLPAVNKGPVVRKMGNTQVQQVGASSANAAQASTTPTATTKPESDTNQIQPKLPSGKSESISTPQVSSPHTDAQGRDSQTSKNPTENDIGKAASITGKDTLPHPSKKYQAPQPPTSSQQPTSNQLINSADKQEKNPPEIAQPSAKEKHTQESPIKIQLDTVDKQQPHLPDKKPPDKLGSNQQPPVNSSVCNTVTDPVTSGVTANQLTKPLEIIADHATETGKDQPNTTKNTQKARRAPSLKKYPAPQPPNSVPASMSADSSEPQSTAVTGTLTRNATASGVDPSTVKAEDRKEDGPGTSVNGASNDVISHSESKCNQQTSLPTTDSVINKQTDILLTEKVTDKTQQSTHSCKVVNSAAAARKVRSGSPIPEKPTLVDVKKTPAVVTGKLEISAAGGSASVKNDSTVKSKVTQNATAADALGDVSPVNKNSLNDECKKNSTNASNTTENQITPAVITGKLEISTTENLSAKKPDSSMTDKQKLQTKDAVKGKVVPKTVNTVENTSCTESKELTKQQPSTVENKTKESESDESKKKTNENGKSEENNDELQKESPPSKKEQNVTDTDGDGKRKKVKEATGKAKDTEMNNVDKAIDRSSRCSSVASDVSRAVSPDISFKSGPKRSRSGKIAAMMDKFEADDVSQVSEAGASKSVNLGKPKPAGAPKVKKISGLASVFESGQGVQPKSEIVNKLLKNPNPYSPPFSPERKPAEPKLTNIAGINTAKFGSVAKFNKKPGDPKKNDVKAPNDKKQLDTNKATTETEKAKETGKDIPKDKDINSECNTGNNRKKDGTNDGKLEKNISIKKEQNDKIQGELKPDSSVIENGEKLVNGDIKSYDSSISTSESEGKEIKKKKKKKEITSAANGSPTSVDAKLVKVDAADKLSGKHKASENLGTTVGVRGSELGTTVPAKVSQVVNSESKDTNTSNTELKDKTAESETVKAKSTEAKDVHKKEPISVVAADAPTAQVAVSKVTTGEGSKNEAGSSNTDATGSVNGVVDVPTALKVVSTVVEAVITKPSDIKEIDIKCADTKAPSGETSKTATVNHVDATPTNNEAHVKISVIENGSNKANSVEAVKAQSITANNANNTSVKVSDVRLDNSEAVTSKATETQLNDSSTINKLPLDVKSSAVKGHSDVSVDVKTDEDKGTKINDSDTGPEISACNVHVVAGKNTEASVKNVEKASVGKEDSSNKEVLGGLKSFIKDVTKGSKVLEDKLHMNGLQFSKMFTKAENLKDTVETDKAPESTKPVIEESIQKAEELGTAHSSTSAPEYSKRTIAIRQKMDDAIQRVDKALPELESEVNALIKEASDLMGKDKVSGKLSASSKDERKSCVQRHATSSGEDEEEFVDAVDPSQLDTLMPLPDVQNERDRRSHSRSRSCTPMEGLERSPSSRSVIAQTEALLSETDRILRRTRSDRSIRRSYSRSLSAAALNKLAEVSADLSEEHTTAHLAGERLEAEQAERMKLEKEVERLQTDMKFVTTANGKLEMEKQALQTEVFSVVNLNGDADHDDDDAADASLYKRKYEWCLREIEVLKKQLKQQQEDDLDHLLLLKKQLEKKVADAHEETEEQRQVVGQMKRKSQRLQAELNDLKILLEEQTSRNNLLEKKQRKFDQDLMAVQEELRHERANKDKIQRERDQILSEKYSFEQEVSTLKLELELKEEKVASLNRELEDLSFTGKAEEEAAALKKGKHDLELRIKDQEEELDDLAGQVQMLEGAKVRLEMSIEQMRKENRREVSQREEELEEVRISAQKKVKVLESQLENEHDERTLLVREKYELERRITDLQDRTVPHVDEDYVHKLKKELKKTKALLRDTQTMLEKSQSEGGHKLLVRQLKTQLEDAEFAKTAAIKARQCAEADLSDLNTQLEEAQRARKESEDRCTRISKDRSEIQTQLEESEEEVAEVMKKYKSVVSQLSVDQITLSEQSQQIAELEHEKQVLQERMLELSSKVEVLEGETANIHTQRRLEMKIKEVESKLELEQTTRQRLESQIGRLKDQIERLSGDCDTARLKEAQALDQSKRVGRQLREAKEDLSSLQQKHTDAVNKKGELEKQLELADSEVATLKSDLKLAFKRIEDLQQAIQGDINDSDSDLSDSDSDSDGSLSSYLTASFKHQRSSSNSTLRTPPSEVQQLDRLEQPHSPSSEAMSAISEDLDDASNKESFA